MTKKEYFEKFFSNSGWGFLGWCIFNLIFGITYFRALNGRAKEND